VEEGRISDEGQASGDKIRLKQRHFSQDSLRALESLEEN